MFLYISLLGSSFDPILDLLSIGEVFNPSVTLGSQGI